MCKFNISAYCDTNTKETSNANNVVFWMIWHVYSNPDLLAELRHEIDRYVQVVSPKSELPIPEPDRLSMNQEALFRTCPLLKATYYETMRMDVQATTYRSVVADFSITESSEDAAMVGRSKPQTYKVPKGEFVCVPHSVHQQDDRYFKDPATFNPKRFYAIDEEKPNEVVVEMGSMHPFGGGPNMCKGKLSEQCQLAWVLCQLTRIIQGEILQKRKCLHLPQLYWRHGISSLW